MRSQLVKTLTEIAEKDSRLVVLLADFAEYQFRGFKEKFPARIYNMGIREQAIVGIAAGMALEGMIPVVYTIAPFLVDRAYEFIKLDLIGHNAHAILVGYNGIEDFYGFSHKRSGVLPSMVFPKTTQELHEAIKFSVSIGTTHYIEIT
jgi:transketolase